MELEKIRSKLRFSNCVWAWVLGTGLVLFVVHNPTLIHRESSGAVDIFLPIVGFAISAIAILMILSPNPKITAKVQMTMGSKWLYIPLLIILASISISGFVNAPAFNGDVYAFIRNGIAPTIFAAFLLGVYVTCRSVGGDVMKPFAWAVVIETFSLVVFRLMNIDMRSGGIVSPTNYDIAAGLLVFGAVVSMGNMQWRTLAIAIFGVFLTGAEEGALALIVIGIAVLIRRDYGKRLITIGIILVLMIGAIFTPEGKVYSRMTLERLDFAQSAIFNDGMKLDNHDAMLSVSAAGFEKAIMNPDSLTRSEKLELATGYRIFGNWNIKDIKPFGHGYEITQFYHGIPHNILLIIIDQVGILAAVAWLFATGYCLIKTKWKYAWLSILALGLVDHYLWTQAAPWWWALAGVSTSSYISNDYIFKGG